MSEPVHARASSSVILLRDSEYGPELLLLERHAQSGFANSAYVFPGGAVIAADSSEGSLSLSPDFSPIDAATTLRSKEGLELSAPESLSFWMAAARELLEEGGVLLHAKHGPLPAEVIDAIRAATLANGASFVAAVREHGGQLGLEQLEYFSHWRTPASLPKRYDTLFFLARMPADQIATHCGIETTDAIWITPARALERADTNELLIVHATRSHLARLAQYDSIEALMEFAASKEVRRVDPIINEDRSISLDPEVAGCW